jgi:CheY-like chemotaxis protein
VPLHRPPLALVVGEDLAVRSLLAELLQDEALDVVAVDHPAEAVLVTGARQPALAVVVAGTDPTVAEQALTTLRRHHGARLPLLLLATDPKRCSPIEHCVTLGMPFALAAFTDALWRAVVRAADDRGTVPGE